MKHGKSIYVPLREEDHRRLKARAALEGMTRGAFVAELIRHALLADQRIEEVRRAD